MKKHKNIFKQNKAQAIMELAIFGAVFAFVLGTLINRSMSISYQQNAQIRAMRIALSMSYYYSHNLMSASRNSASVIFIEDRLSAGAGKYGSFDRMPIIASGSGTLSRNLYMPVDFNDDDDLGVVDVFINGKHVVLTTAGFNTLSVAGEVGTGGTVAPVMFYKQVINHPDIGTVPNVGSLIHPAAAAKGETGATNCMAGRGVFGAYGAAAFGNCLWGWREVSSNLVNVEDSENTVLDVDGDLQDETILGMVIQIKTTDVILDTEDVDDFVTDDEGEYELVSIHVVDYQNGQIDNTRASHKGMPQGLTNDLVMDSSKRGSLVVDGGYSEPNRSGTADTITREIRLNPNRTGSDATMGCSYISGNICYVTTTLTTP